MFKKKKRKEELAFSNGGSSGNGDSESYSPVDALPSFDNPVYASGPGSESRDAGNPDNPVYEELKDAKLDEYEIPKLKTENPYVFN